MISRLFSFLDVLARITGWVLIVSVAVGFVVLLVVSLFGDVGRLVDGDFSDEPRWRR